MELIAKRISSICILLISPGNRNRKCNRNNTGPLFNIIFSVNNAGICCFMILEFTDLQEIRDIMEVNFFGTLRMTQEVLPLMKRRQSGRIITVSSEAGIFGEKYIYNRDLWMIRYNSNTRIL